MRFLKPHWSGVLGIFLSPALFGSPTSQQLRLPTPVLEKFPNGLEVAWFLDQKLPSLDLALLVTAGSVHDPVGKSGLANLVSASLDQGSERYSREVFSKKVDRLGASRYAQASEDGTSIGLHGLSVDAAELLEILEQMVMSPSFPDAAVREEQSRLAEKWRHVLDNAGSVASLVSDRWSSSGGPYGRGEVRNLREFSGLSSLDVKKFHSAHYRPERSILMVVGRVNQENFREWIRKGFGAWKGVGTAGSTKPAVNRWTDPTLPGKSREILLIPREGATQAEIRISFPAPLIRTPARYPLAVFNALAGEYFNSRLVSRLRDELGLTYSVGSGFEFRKELAVWNIGAATEVSTTGRFLKELETVLQGLRGEPFSLKITDQEVGTSKAYLLGSFPIGFSHLSAVASRWLSGRVFGLGGEDYLNEFVPQIEKVTVEEVRKASQDLLRMERSKVVIAGNVEAIRESLKASGFEKVRVLPVEPWWLGESPRQKPRPSGR
jgi:zinc protease